jgi:uncharacterized protein YpbB
VHFESAPSIFTVVPLTTTSLSHTATQVKRFQPVSVNSHLLKVTQYAKQMEEANKNKGKALSAHAMKVHRGSTGIAPFILNPCTRWR